ncbi:MAG: hypothetical protein QOI42_23, partial [Frankiaceae bacterium]|nr:hypothetical protein [Frankiaceae bacterium]
MTLASMRRHPVSPSPATGRGGAASR